MLVTLACEYDQRADNYSGRAGREFQPYQDEGRLILYPSSCGKPDIAIDFGCP